MLIYSKHQRHFSVPDPLSAYQTPYPALQKGLIYPIPTTSIHIVQRATSSLLSQASQERANTSQHPAYDNSKPFSAPTTALRKQNLHRRRSNTTSRISNLLTNPHEHYPKHDTISPPRKAHARSKPKPVSQ